MIDGAAGLHRQGFEPDPDQERTAEVIPLDPGLTALAAFQPGDWLAVAVDRLKLPAEATPRSRSRRGRLRGRGSHDPVRAVGSPLTPEPGHRMRGGKTLELDALAVGPLVSLPVQRGHAAIGPLTAGSLPVAGGLDRALVDCLQLFKGQHPVVGRIPGVHPHGLNRQRRLGYPLDQPLTDVLKLGVPVAVRSGTPRVDPPELIQARVTGDAGHYPNALDDRVGIPAVWVAHQGKG